MRQEPAGPQKTGLPPPNDHQSKGTRHVAQDQQHKEDQEHQDHRAAPSRSQQLQASIADQVDQLRNSEQWIRFLQFARSLHHYRLSNLILIMAQRPTATRVAGFRQWQAKGRQVRKGEKSIKIFGYAEKTITSDTDQEDDGAAEDERIVYFPILSVFDISQTDPTGSDDDPLTIGKGRLNSEDPDGIADAVTDYLTGQGWNVHRRTIRGADGFTDPRSHRVVIEASLSPADTAATLLHEAAHVILHAQEPAGEYRQHRGIKETEAESVAYVVAGLLGLDTSPTSISYVTGWSDGDTDAIRDTASRVLQAVGILSDALITENAKHAAA